MVMTNAIFKIWEHLDYWTCALNKGKDGRIRDTNGISWQAAAYVAEMVLRVPVLTITVVGGMVWYGMDRLLLTWRRWCWGCRCIPSPAPSPWWARSRRPARPCPWTPPPRPSQQRTPSSWPSSLFTISEMENYFTNELLLLRNCYSICLLSPHE